MYRSGALLVLMLAFAAAKADELPQPRKLGDAGTASPPLLLEPPPDDGGKALNALRNDVHLLQSAREALKTELDAVPAGDACQPTKAEEIAHMKKRLAEALLKLETSQIQKAVKPAPAPVKPAAPSQPSPSVGGGQGGGPSPPTAGVVPPHADGPATEPFAGSVVDALALAPVLFQTGDYEGALTAYRLVSPDAVKPAERVTVTYMTAACLRKLGKTDEAATLFREVANAKGEDVLAECAQWQLSAMRWKHDVETTLNELRQRRKALETPEAKP
jgi:hypothetical protein